MAPLHPLKKGPNDVLGFKSACVERSRAFAACGEVGGATTFILRPSLFGGTRVGNRVGREHCPTLLLPYVTLGNPTSYACG